MYVLKFMLTFSSSLASPTSRCLASAAEPLVSAAPAAALHGDAMVPAASAPLAATNRYVVLATEFCRVIVVLRKG